MVKESTSRYIWWVEAKDPPVVDKRQKHVKRLQSRIPDHIQIGSHRHVIKKNKRLGRWAKINPNSHVITLDRYSPSGHKLAETLVHECLHGIFLERFLWRGSDKIGPRAEEHLIQHLAGGIVSLFTANPWLLKWLRDAILEE